MVNNHVFEKNVTLLKKGGNSFHQSNRFFAYNKCRPVPNSKFKIGIKVRVYSNYIFNLKSSSKSGGRNCNVPNIINSRKKNNDNDNKNNSDNDE